MAPNFRDAIPAELKGAELADIPHVYDLILETVELNPDGEAIVSLHQSPLRLPGLDEYHDCSSLRWTYEMLKRGGSHLSAQLAASGIEKGTAIVFFCENRAEWALICWAAILLGCPFVPLNPRLASNAEELNYILGQVSPGVIVVVGEKTGTALQTNANKQLLRAQLLLSLEDIHYPCMDQDSRWMSLAQFWSCTPVTKRGLGVAIYEDTAVIGLTSGTTSFPKACPQSSDNLMTSALTVRELRGLDKADRLCQHLPSFAAMAVLISLTSFISGSTMVYPSASFSASATLDAIEQERCTYTFAAPAMVKALAMHPTIKGRSLTSLRMVELGGAPIYPDVLRVVTSEQGLNCERVGCGWGMTESPAPLLAEPWERSMPLPADYIGVGKPARGTFAKICHPDSHRPIRCGQEGELHVGGPQVVRGYLKGDNEVFYEENGIQWIKTGDMARIEDGQIFIVGRYKDIIIRGGQNISPAKLERILAKVAGVDTQVVGLFDDLAGEVPVAVLKYHSGHPPVEQILEDMRNLAMRDLAPSEALHAFIPLHELGLDDFPMTLSGKIQKAVLSKHVREYWSKQHSETTGVAEATTEDVLLRLWSQVSGIPVSSIDPHASTFGFADSITTMRLSTLVKNRLKKDLTVDEAIKHSSIAEQAALLDSRPVNLTFGSKSQRPDPPTASEMVHCNGDHAKMLATKEKVNKFLAKLHMSWDDVKDVFPAPDTSYIYLNRQRPQTWNQRAIYVAPETSVEVLISTWKAVLVHHDMLRTVAVPAETLDADDPKHFFVVLRPNDTFWNHSTNTGLEVGTVDELRSTFRNEWADVLCCPLVRVAFIRIKDTESSGFIFVSNHAPLDNLSMDLLIADLETTLTHNLTAENILQAPGHLPYKLFADQYYQYRSTNEAHIAVNFHASRLLGISGLRDSLWPKPRVPGWFKGPDAGWTYPDGTAGDPSLREPIDPPGERHGLDGLTRTAPVKTLQTLKDAHGILPHVVLKVAVALFNMRKTSTTTALFANVEAGRRWPASTSEPLPNPLNIAGPMFQVVLNRITLASPQEPVLNLLERVQGEQKLLSMHSQAPLFLIKTFLPEDDGEVFFEALTRQGYNWAPGIQVVSVNSENAPKLVKHSRQALDDIGLAWTCGLRNRETFYANASYDDCQLGKDEVYKYLGEVLSAGVWLADPENAEKGVDECVFDGGGVSELIKSLE